MRKFLTTVWFPAAIVCAAALQATYRPVCTDRTVVVREAELSMLEEPSQDTVIYGSPGYKQFWTAEEKAGKAGGPAGVSAQEDSLGLEDVPSDSTVRPAALDTLIAPDSLKSSDIFRYTYYAAIKDSLCHKWVKDSLIASGDTLVWPKLDSLYKADSTATAKAAFALWYASLDKKERKKYDMEQALPLKLAMQDSLQNVKDSLKSIRDSIVNSTPRILQTFALPDSMKYKRIIMWTRDRSFHQMSVSLPDTSFNYHYNDYPFLKKDVNATWLGVAGSPVQSFDFFKRKYTEGVSFYEPLESWSYSASTVHFYNTKTPHTELAYWGTLFADRQKMSDNIHILTTQNILPELNLTLEFNRYGGEGILEHESTANKTFLATTNYTGKKYLMHAGYIYNMVARDENGGILDNTLIRDTTINAREIPIGLSNATSKIKKTTVFLDQQYRIPFNFLKGGKKNKADSLSSKTADSLATEAKQDSLAFDTDVTTAFIGHSSEFSTYRRKYEDDLTTEAERAYYNNTFYYHPSQAKDSSRVMRLDNKVFLRLQPWSSEGVVSKLDVGVGDRLMHYYMMDSTFLHKTSYQQWNSAYIYAGAEGQIKNYVHWNALGDFVFAGQEAGDFNISANAGFNFYPFRRDRKSPISVNAHFETSLDEPDFYQQHYFSNHFRWENQFSKISTTKIQGSISIPHWKLNAEVGYSLLANNIYYDTLGIVRQNTAPMSILSARLDKNFIIANFLHLDNKILFQMSSNQDVVPLPLVALNLRYYIQFTIQKVLAMQIGANAFYNTAWYAPGWNPNVGTFYNQKTEKYGDCPYIDVFVNMQWKRACIFVKVENIGQGWPNDRADYFSAHHYIRTQRALKIGFFWPFYVQPARGGQSDSSKSKPNNARMN